MARGWGRSEEDLGSDREQGADSGTAASARRSPAETALASQRRQLELSLARVDEQLAVTASPPRRLALESARTELQARLVRLGETVDG